jgi:hypothetical protein
MENLVNALRAANPAHFALGAHIVGVLIFLGPTINSTRAAFNRQSLIPEARSMGFTDELIEKINLLSKFYVLFLYTQVITRVYGVYSSSASTYLDILVFGYFAFWLIKTKWDAVRLFRVRWKRDDEKAGYLHRQLTRFGGTAREVWGLLAASVALLAVANLRYLVDVAVKF